MEGPSIHGEKLSYAGSVKQLVDLMVTVSVDLIYQHYSYLQDL